MHPCGGCFHKRNKKGDLPLLFRGELLVPGRCCLSLSQSEAWCKEQHAVCGCLWYIIAVLRVWESQWAGCLEAAQVSHVWSQVTPELLHWDAVIAQHWKETVNSCLHVSCHSGCMTEAWVRNWGVRDGCSGAMPTKKPCPAQKLREKPEPEEFNSSTHTLCIPFRYCSAKRFRIRCSVRDLMERERDGREGRKLLCHFPFSVCWLALRGETRLWLFPVWCPARCGSTGCSSGSGWLWLVPMQRGPRLSADVLCYEQSRMVVYWGAFAAPVDLGTLSEKRQGKQWLRHLFGECLIHLPFVRQHLCFAIQKQ